MNKKHCIVLTLITLLHFNLHSTPTISLNENWKFRMVGETEWLPANVPGCVHTDLLNNKKIEDPFFRTNEEKIQWIGQKDWEYTTTFDAPESILNAEKIQLEFQGLDTYADVYLNNQLVLSANNMHRTWKIDCSGKLKKQDNLLRVVFHSVFKKTLPLLKESPLPLFQFYNNDQADTMVSLFIRKAGYHFGWDWGPRLVTSGIWKSVELQAWNNARIEGGHVITKNINSTSAQMQANIQISTLRDTLANISIYNGNSELIKKQITLKKGENHINLAFAIENPKLWWSNGLGEANLYNFNCKLKIGKSNIDSLIVCTGIRTIKVVTDSDQYGKSLYVELNGKKVFMKGANYIPNDAFSNRVTNSTYEYIIKSAADANMNMLRLWGGGIFEKDIFYNLCDKYGILIWHDMLFACGTYPADKEYLSNITNEITDNVKRIRNHPSIALWNGNNEVEMAYNNWGWKEKLNAEQQKIQEANTQTLFYKTIPAAIFSVDSSRYYHFSSPNTGYKKIGMNMGDVHYWAIWHGKVPFESYNTQIGRFMSEYGFQSYPEPQSVEKFTIPEDRNIDSKTMQAHQRCMADDGRDKSYGNRLIKHYMDQYYHEPKDFNSYLYVSQLLQAKGVKMALEAHRRNMPFCMGTLYWQLNDCWPVASWSSIDYYGKWKALHYAAREAFKDVLISSIIENGKANIYIISDRQSRSNGQLLLTLRSFDGKVLLNQKINVQTPENASILAYSINESELLKAAIKNNCLLQVSLVENNKELTTNTLYFVPEKEMQLAKPQINYEITSNGNEAIVTFKTDVLSKNVFLTITDSTNVSFSNNFFDLIPGQPQAITIKGNKPLTSLKQHLHIESLVDTY